MCGKCPVTKDSTLLAFIVVLVSYFHRNGKFSPPISLSVRGIIMKAIICNNFFDGNGLEMMHGQTLLIEHGKIVSFRASDEMEIPEGAEIIDAGDRTVMPGLIDCHDHLASFGYDIASRWGLTEQATHRHMRIANVLRQTLESGYTTVRDAGGLAAGFRDAVDEGLASGPRLLVSLGIISPTGGIGEHLSPSGYGNPLVSDPSLPCGVANGPVEMRTKVREMVRSGADVIKFAATGGASSRSGLEPRDMLISREEITAIVDEAHFLGRKVMCHALGGPGLRASIEAGVDSIEHGTFLHEDLALVDMMAKKGIFFTPTFSVYKYHSKKGSPHGRRRAIELQSDHVASLAAAVEGGVAVASGTDAGGWVHGNNAEELSCLVDAGMSPAQALRAATGAAATCVGLQECVGTLDEGKQADLIFVEGNPLDDISTLEYGRNVSLVMKGGDVVYRNG